MINPDDAPREHYSNLADPPWSIVAGGRVLGTGATGTDAWRAVLATAEAERDALRQQVEAWQPIATAPTNGARVLLWYAPTRIDKGEAVEGFWDSLFDGQWMTSRGSSYIDGRLRRPTHWMPLPRGPGESA
jgi:hypothetical protein